jgi:hypothetical protein
MDRWMGERVHGWMDGCEDGWISILDLNLDVPKSPHHILEAEDMMYVCAC